MRSAAAPTYFPVYQGYCDGAVTANNPSLVAVSMALAHYPGLRRENIRVRNETRMHTVCLGKHRQATRLELEQNQRSIFFTINMALYT